MLPIYKYLSLLVFMLILIGCNKRVNDPAEKLSQDDRIDIEQFGERNTLEIATWNIEMFPMHNKTVSDVTEIILDLEIDIYAVQEITDNADFQRMLDSINVVDSLNQYDGRLNDEASFLKTGIIYKKSIVDVLADTHLFVGDNDFAGRPPYVLSVKAEKNNQIFDFNLIVLHLKAFDDPDSRARRQRAILKLENYVASQLQSGSDPDYIIAGDWNDLLDDSGTDNVFRPFLEDSSSYQFLTEPFKGSSTEFSYIGGNFRSLIDHILITASVENTYPDISAKILKIDQQFSAYLNEVSDHRPVATKVPVF